MPRGFWDPDRERRAPWALGAFLLVRRAAWDAAGGFDPGQWLHAEDLDLRWRLQLAGRPTRYVPSARVRHAESASIAPVWGEARTARWMAASYDWMLRHRGPVRTRATAFIHASGAAARARCGIGDRAAYRRWAALHRMGLGSAASIRGRLPRPPIHRRRIAARMTTTHEPSAHYDRVTQAWTLLLGKDLHYGVFDRGDEALPTATARLTELMVEAAAFAPGDAVLDVGCGTGAPACHLAGTHGVRVTGITTSAVGVAAARECAAAAGLADRTAFEARDGMDNGFPDASFDRVWVLESSHLMRDRDRLVAECARVLRPGGRMVLCDLVLRRPIPFEEVRRRRHEFSLLRRAFGDARMEELGTYATLACAAGLVVERETDLTAATRPTFDRWRANARAHRDRLVELLGAEGLEEFVASCDVLEGLWDDGTMGYGLLAARRDRG